MFSRTATSIVLLTVLLAGIITPTGFCVLMCERHLRAEAHRQCSRNSGTMPGMAHDHSAMHHAAIGDVTLIVGAQTCRTDCAMAEPFSISRKVVPQLIVVQTGVVLADVTVKFLSPDIQAAWSLDGGPPSLPSSHTAAYSILRI